MKVQRYCCFCGNELILKTLNDGSKEKYCILLARGTGWKHPYWALISGHIRSEETAEETAIREVHEEVGLRISSLEFLKTYATKYRDLLMIAFKAETEKTSIKKAQELEATRWFSLHDPLPLRHASTAAHVVQHVFPHIKYIDLNDLEKIT